MFTITFKTETQTTYLMTPNNKFEIVYNKVQKIATVYVTVFNHTNPQGERVKTYKTLNTFKKVRDAKDFCWENERVKAEDLLCEECELVAQY